MTYPEILRRLTESQALSPTEAEALAAYEQQRPFSVHGELRTALYFGVTMLSAGLGILIYQNLDTIGHQVVIALIAALMLGCFGYVWWHRKPYANGLVLSDSSLVDFILLLGCLLFLTLEGYLQVQYNVFGNRYGLVTAIPAVFFLALAYRFDHRGVLTMGVTALASWVGLTVAPLRVLTENDFAQPRLLNTALVFGVVVITTALALDWRGIKRHFTATYLTLAGNLALVAATAGWFGDNLPGAYLLVLLLLCAGFGVYARQRHSFLFLVMALVYGYIGITYLFFKILPEEVLYGFGMYYFIFSCGLIVWFLFRYKRLLGVEKPQPVAVPTPPAATSQDESNPS
ncbi:MAG: DUF2157 domain-containing protein [Cytophagaceae bacterium]|nr:DUF2157 domain-containing protein [Cytophagaceae bacterium]